MYLIKVIPRYHLKTDILGTIKIIEYPRNVSKADLSVFPNSVSEFKTRISGTKIYLTSFWFCEKSWNISKYLKN